MIIDDRIISSPPEAGHLLSLPKSYYGYECHLLHLAARGLRNEKLLFLNRKVKLTISWLVHTVTPGSHC